jgi:hypothetical protein
LLPYLEFDGVKKMVNVNYPVKMSMTSQPCTYSVNLNFKKSKKNTSCKECAINCHNGTYVCKKHYELSLIDPLDANTTESSPTSAPSVCGVILRYGKIKAIPAPIRHRVAYIKTTKQSPPPPPLNEDNYLYVLHFSFIFNLINIYRNIILYLYIYL